MQLINNSYYETLSSLCKKWGSVQAGTAKFIGVNTFGVRSTYSNEDILRNRKVHTVIHEFQTVLDPKSSLGICLLIVFEKIRHCLPSQIIMVGFTLLIAYLQKAL